MDSITGPESREKKTNQLTLILVVSAVFWGIMLLSQAQLRSWDGFTHIFFADGYAEDWWSVWDERWYGGYAKVSYPPLSHQIIALLILVTKSPNFAYSISLWIFLTIGPLGIYRFSKIFVNDEASVIASLSFVFLVSTKTMTFIFGQYAGYVAFVFLLFGLKAVDDFLMQHDWLSAVMAISWFGCVAATHTNTLIFLTPSLLLTVLLNYYLNYRDNQKVKFIILTMVIISVVVISATAIIPFWRWMQNYSMQEPIEHPSRWSLIAIWDSRLGRGIVDLYFLRIHGFLLLAYPVMTYELIRAKRNIVLLICAITYFILGLGGTTPLPLILFGQSWEWLTYERFAIWANIISLPLITDSLLIAKNLLWKNLLKVSLMLSIMFSIVSMLNPSRSLPNPTAINLSPAIEVLNSDSKCQSRYLSLGFGYQMPEFSILTNSNTLDGLWHTARTDEMLRSSGIGSLDSALSWDNGEKTLRLFLSREDVIPAYCVFLNESNFIYSGKYESILLDLGWKKTQMLNEFISLWMYPNEVRTLVKPTEQGRLIDKLLWGILPLSLLFLALSIEAIRSRYRRL